MWVTYLREDRKFRMPGRPLFGIHLFTLALYDYFGRDILANECCMMVPPFCFDCEDPYNLTPSK